MNGLTLVTTIVFNEARMLPRTREKRFITATRCRYLHRHRRYFRYHSHTVNGINPAAPIIRNRQASHSLGFWRYCRISTMNRSNPENRRHPNRIQPGMAQVAPEPQCILTLARAEDPQGGAPAGGASKNFKGKKPKPWSALLSLPFVFITVCLCMYMHMYIYIYVYIYIYRTQGWGKRKETYLCKYG